MKKFFGVAVIAMLVSSLSGCSEPPEQQAAEAPAEPSATRPNILLVMADDMGWTDLGSYGSEIATPHLDALADRGVKFTDFHVSVSCSPTRSMLLSGTDNHVAGLGNMGEMLRPNQRGKPGYEGHLNDRVVSLAEALRADGYHTYMAGKWHLGHDANQYPAARGFERSFSMLFGGASYWSDMFGMLAVHEEVAEYVEDDQLLDELPDDFYATRSYADFLMNAIRADRADGKPFLAYLAFTAPHDPMHVPEPWLSKYRGRYDGGYAELKARRADRAKELGLVAADAALPAPHLMLQDWDSLSAEEQALQSRGMEAYAGLVENMDYHYGRVIDFLKDVGEYDNTIIIFLSDNGPNPWSSEDYPGNAGSEWFAQFDNSIDNIGNPMSHYAYGMGWGSASAGPLDLFKMTVGEGGIRAPLIIAGPGIQADKQAAAFAYVWDIMPTILEYAGVSYPEQHEGRAIEPMRGRSLKPVLSGAADNVYAADELISGEMQNGKWIRQGSYKAVAVSAPYGDGIWRLYNLADDPGETNDLAAVEPDRMAALQAAWQDYADDVGVVAGE
ncbi:MAG TPA: sulfatase [Gammaproteobacteria bacterium]|nr:sulfatase [Gammaproteobacteria bacterium]